eukprot:7875751-Pyramimonas_sp.AAC.1
MWAQPLGAKRVRCTPMEGNCCGRICWGLSWSSLSGHETCKACAAICVEPHVDAHAGAWATNRERVCRNVRGACAEMSWRMPCDTTLGP